MTEPHAAVAAPAPTRLPAAAPLPRRRRGLWSGRRGPAPVDPAPVPEPGSDGPVISARGITAGYPRVPVLRAIDLTVSPGEIVALMGRNGAGKSTLLSVLAGARLPESGTARVAGADPAVLRGRELISRVGLVPQDPTDLLYATSVAQECADADGMAGVAPGTAAALLSDLSPGIAGDAHPRDLSEGQRLALALAVVLASAPPVLLLDEPTRGLDYGAKRRLVSFLSRHRGSGASVLLATHDVELVAEVATRVIILADGEFVADGPTAPVVRSSPLFAPQVAKILAPGPWLTVGEVSRALAAIG